MGLPTPIKSLSTKVDHTALITQMSAALKAASDAWDEVCGSYLIGWQTAYDNYTDALAKSGEVRKARLLAERERLMWAAEFALAIIPGAGLCLCPILTARASLLARYVAREVNTAAIQAPIISRIAPLLAAEAKKPLFEITSNIKNSILDKLIPMDSVQELNSVAASTPAQFSQAYTDSVKRVRGEMDRWVLTVAGWNTQNGIERMLIPLAHELFMKHPWIADVPTESQAQSARPQIARAIELGLWLRWLSNLDLDKWSKIDDSLKEYRGALNMDGKQIRRDRYREELDQIVDLYPLWPRLREIDKRFRHMYADVLEYANMRGFSVAGDRRCPDMYPMIFTARTKGSHMLYTSLYEIFGLRASLHSVSHGLLKATGTEMNWGE